MAEKENVIDQTVGKIFGKLGITGLATAILMIVFGILIIIFQWLIPWLIGLYLIIVGVINLVGYIPALTAKSQPAPQAPPQRGRSRIK